MSVRNCAQCTTAYAVDLDGCPHCGHSDTAAANSTNEASTTQPATDPAPRVTPRET